MKKKLYLSDRTISIILFIAFVAAFVPVFRLAYYACPFYDDYNYCRYVKNFYEAYGPKGIWGGVKYTVKGMWYAWQGTYSSTAFMSLTPLFLGEEYYYLGVWALLFFTIINIAVFSAVCVKKLLNGTFDNIVSFSIILILYLLEFIYISYQGIFWYNSAVHYTFMHGIMLLMLAMEILCITSTRLWKTVVYGIITAALAGIVAGSNYVTCLQGIIFLVTIIVFAAFRRKRQIIALIPAVILYIWGFVYNVTAPGNSMRADYFTGESVAKAIFDSFVQAVKDIPRLTSLTSIFVVLMMLPVILSIVKKTEYTYKFPALVTALSFGYYATGYTSSFYAGSEAPVDRTMVAVKMTYQILLILNVIYWCGWICMKKKLEEKNRHNVLYYSLLIVCMLISFTFMKDKAGGVLSYGSFYATHTGFAQNCRQEYLNRIEIIKSSDEDDVGVPPIVFRTWLLIGNSELSTNMNADQNHAMAGFYHKEHVYLDTNYNSGDTK